jgi:hypothetical protein
MFPETAWILTFLIFVASILALRQFAEKSTDTG